MVRTLTAACFYETLLTVTKWVPYTVSADVPQTVLIYITVHMIVYPMIYSLLANYMNNNSSTFVNVYWNIAVIYMYQKYTFVWGGL